MADMNGEYSTGLWEPQVEDDKRREPPPGSPGLPLPPGTAAAPEAGQWANSNQGFLDWSTARYGADPERGSGFVNEAAGGGFEKMLGDYGRATGNTATYLAGPSGDRADFGQGVQDARTSDGKIWNNERTGAGGPGGSRPPGGGGGGGYGGDTYLNGVPGGRGGGPGGSTSSSGPRGGDGWMGTTPGQGTDLFNALLKRSQQSLAVDATDPIIRNQADAHGAQLERGRTKYLQEQAERGGNNANISAEQRSSAEQVGQGTADFESALMGQEVTARRQEIQHALDGARGILSDEQQLQLQEELAQLSRAESRYQFDSGMGQRESEFGRSLGQRESEFGRNLGQGAYEFDVNDRFRNSPLNG